VAVVRLSDVIVPEVFFSYMVSDTMVKSNVFTSGIVQPDAFMASALAGGGRVFQHPTWGDLDNSDPVVVNDNPASVITPKKISAFKHQFIRQVNAQSWSSALLTQELAGSNPMQRIISRVSDYWARYFNRMVISTITGIINDNIANDGGDMVYSAGVGVGGATPSAAISAAAILEA